MGPFLKLSQAIELAREHKFSGILINSTWAVTDHGLFAGANFITNVLLARLLVPSAYGEFTVAYTIFLFLGAVHAALLTEPMLVYGAGRFRSNVSAYLRAVLFGHFIISLIGGLLLALSGIIARGVGLSSIGASLMVLSLAQPFILLLWLLRRACYLIGTPRRAAAASATYMILLLFSIATASRLGQLSVSTSLLLMASCSLIVAIWIGLRLKLFVSERSNQWVFRDVVQAHWEYGKWATAATGTGFIPVNIYYLLLPAFCTLKDTATLKALINLITPALQGLSAISTTLLPALVRRRGTPSFGKAVRIGLVVLGTVSLVYWIALGVFHAPMVRLLYGKKYVDESALLWIIGAVPVGTALSVVLSNALRAEENTSAVFRGAVIAAFLSLVIGLPLVVWFGIRGAALGMASYLMLFTIVLYPPCAPLFRRTVNTGNDVLPEVPVEGL
jgi:O-antigen/teichoic acid export membrane protein